jgi:hypothetical protein
MTKKIPNPCLFYFLVSHIFYFSSFIRFHKFLKQFIAKCNEYNQRIGTYTSIRTKIYEILETFPYFLSLRFVITLLCFKVESSLEQLRKKILQQFSSIVPTWFIRFKDFFKLYWMWRLILDSNEADMMAQSFYFCKLKKNFFHQLFVCSLLSIYTIFFFASVSRAFISWWERKKNFWCLRA